MTISSQIMLALKAEIWTSESCTLAHQHTQARAKVPPKSLRRFINQGHKYLIALQYAVQVLLLLARHSPVLPASVAAELETQVIRRRLPVTSARVMQ